MQMTPTEKVLIIAMSLVTATVATAQSDPTGLSPKDHFVRIEMAMKDAATRYGSDLEAAKSDDARIIEIKDRYTAEAHKRANEGLELARKYPGDPIAVEALRFVIRTARMGPSDASYKAIELLARDHATDGKMGEVCEEIYYFFSSAPAESLIRDVLSRNPSRDARGLACHALANALRYRPLGS